jgi:hypothetical protein
VKICDYHLVDDLESNLCDLDNNVLIQKSFDKLLTILIPSVNISKVLLITEYFGGCFYVL